MRHGGGPSSTRAQRTLCACSIVCIVEHALQEYATGDAHVCGVQAEARVLYAHEVPPLASDERVIIVCFQLPITASRCNVQRTTCKVQRAALTHSSFCLCRPRSMTDRLTPRSYSALLTHLCTLRL